jgi:hypothetical protein
LRRVEVETETIEQGAIILEIPSAKMMRAAAGWMGRLELDGTPAEVVQRVYVDFILEETIEIEEDA